MHTNEDTTNINQILLVYLKDIVVGSFIAPSKRYTYMIGNSGLHFVNGLLNDPVNNYLAYLFTTDKNLNSRTFGVYKMDFNFVTPKYVYTILTMSSG